MSFHWIVEYVSMFNQVQCKMATIQTLIGILMWHFFFLIKENAGKSWWFRNISLYLQIKILKADNMDLTHNIIEYVNCCVGAFANRFKLSSADSYAYLRRFKGIDFLVDCYAAEHTLSIEDAVEDIAILCQKNGGRLGC